MDGKQLFQQSVPKVVINALCQSKLLLQDQQGHYNYDAIHSVKSVLYVAIEQTGVKAERLTTVQRMLRELLAIVTTSVELRIYEREVGKQIIEEIINRYPETISS